MEGANNVRKQGLCRWGIGFACFAAGASAPADPSVEFAVVRHKDELAGGPRYDFRISRFETRNDQFAAFLNDAYHRRSDLQGQFLYHDVDSGSVYINDTVDGAEGTTAPSPTLSVRVYDASLGRIHFDAESVDPYVVNAGFANHPVVGVSWYGAAKYCNWLTLSHGMPATERIYAEGSAPAHWRSVGFDPAVSESNKHGYRLPMDGGLSGVGPYNEWLKGAAARRDIHGTLVFDARYGFGRDALDIVDANFLDSRDPYDDDTTPVGFFNGVDRLADAAPTRDSANAYEFHDLCGNVAEWVHDRGATIGATRGGHFLHPRGFAALRVDAREVLPLESTFTFVGFRVAQSLVLTAPRIIQEASETRADGYVGGPWMNERFVIELHNNASYAIDALSISLDSTWLELEGTAPGIVPPRSAIEIPVRLSSTAASLSVSPQPPHSFAFVTADDFQNHGPDYDFWMSRTEVTNDQFVAFLNDALANLTNERGAFLFHDTESGSVYLHDEEDGRVGARACCDNLTTLMYDAQIGRIHLSGRQYAVESEFGSHPVVGVTWYGAVKYCNWLTLHSGLPKAMRAYAEGPSSADWRPVSVSLEDWMARGMDDAERWMLIETTAGYRLPMDGGSNTAAPVNEWYKAASAHRDAADYPVFDAAYGFGRDALTSSDANFLSSGDTDVDETTPVGHFDGVHSLAGKETLTVANENHYGLFDLCGNVAEWTADQFGGGGLRSTRGGSWMDGIDSDALRNSARTGLAPGERNTYTGFRVVRGTGHVASVTVHDPISNTDQVAHVILDLGEPLQFTPRTGLRVEGIYCDDFTGHDTSYTITNQSATQMPWAVAVSPRVEWLTAMNPTDASLSGTLAESGGSVEISVSTNSFANRLAPGEHAAEIVLTNPRTATQSRRAVGLTIANPLHVESIQGIEWATVWAGRFSDLPPASASLSRAEAANPSCSLDYVVSPAAPWLSIAPTLPDGSLTGPLPATPEALPFEVRVNDEAVELAVGEHEGEVSFSFVDPLNPAMQPHPIRQRFRLAIEEPLTVAGGGDWVICCRLSADNLPSRDYTVMNQHPTRAIPATVQVDVPWIDVDADELSVLPNGISTIGLSLTAQAPQTHGEYPATMTVTDVATGQMHTRNVLLRILENLSVSPLGDFASAAKVGGAFQPTHKVYTIKNHNESTEIQWRASSDQPWILLNGNAAASGALPAGQSTRIVVSIDATRAPTLPAETNEQIFEALLSFEDLTHVETATGRVLLTLVRPSFDLAERVIGTAQAQPGGPEYTFFMAQFHVTNTEFTTFLNDAIENPEHPRGQYVYVESGTGDVYINTAAIGQVGTDHEGRAHRMFSPAAGGQIRFLAGRFTVVTEPIDYSLHPLAGVSWYGAVKFCNWLTIDHGMLPEERCYVEDTDGNPRGWRPTTISADDWQDRDLIDGERERLVGGCRGFRLPMDDGYNNATASMDSADRFNEWFKAASWNDGLRQNVLYGFGRNSLTGADANFRCSGDGFEDMVDCALGGTTPAGYFDGTLRAAFFTHLNENAFDLYDMTGNVHQWLQDQYAPTSSLDRRTLRGGSWNDAVASAALRNSSRTLFASPGTNSSQIGFRVLRVPAPRDGDFDGDGRTDLPDFASFVTCLSGIGTAAEAMCATFDADEDGDVDLLDAAAFLVEFDDEGRQ
jgi:formylglycine-generating enzyme required for sulfatase activity